MSNVLIITDVVNSNVASLFEDEASDWGSPQEEVPLDTPMETNFRDVRRLGERARRVVQEEEEEAIHAQAQRHAQKEASFSTG